MIALFLKLFFIIPIWLLKLITFRKRVLVNGQILDYQTQIFLGLQSFESIDLGSFDSAEEVRETITKKQMGLPINAKPTSKVLLQDHIIDEDGLSLAVREYVPDILLHSNPILYFHGGGYVLGSIESHDPWLKLFSSHMQSNIFSLEYRLAPENKFPAALKDANQALEWIAKKNDISISSISICGDSAGAHLAASLSIYRAMNNLELPHSQCLIYPMADPSCTSESQQAFQIGYGLTKDAMMWFWDQLFHSKEDLSDPRFNLLLNNDIKPLPKTIIVTAGFDPLCDEGEEYARKLFDAGNDVQQIHYPHLIHGFVNMTSLQSANKAALDLIKTYGTYFKT